MTSFVHGCFGETDRRGRGLWLALAVGGALVGGGCRTSVDPARFTDHGMVAGARDEEPIADEPVAPVEPAAAEDAVIAVDEPTAPSEVPPVEAAPSQPVDAGAPTSGDRPPAAGPGEAWCRVWIEPVHETRFERVLVQPARTIKRWIAPVYGKRMRVVCDSPAEIQETIDPGVFGTRRRRVVTEVPHTEWQRTRVGSGPCDCRECIKKIEHPAVVGEVCERVCIEPARAVLKFRPASWRVVEEDYVIEPGFCEDVCLPPRYETRSTNVCVKPGRWEWRRNVACDVPVRASLPALETRFWEERADGTSEGIFAVGETVRFELRVQHEEGDAVLADLGVHFTLPPELEFISGRGVGTPITVTGSGQSASTSAFTLSVGDERAIQLLARVTRVPVDNFVKTEAVIQTADGQVLATEVESTTLREPPGLNPTPVGLGVPPADR